jgi:hypothetical protein
MARSTRTIYTWGRRARRMRGRALRAAPGTLAAGHAGRAPSRGPRQPSAASRAAPVSCRAPRARAPESREPRRAGATPCRGTTVARAEAAPCRGRAAQGPRRVGAPRPRQAGAAPSRDGEGGHEGGEAAPSRAPQPHARHAEPPWPRAEATPRTGWGRRLRHARTAGAAPCRGARHVGGPRRARWQGARRARGPRRAGAPRPREPRARGGGRSGKRKAVEKETRRLTADDEVARMDGVGAGAAPGGEGDLGERER